MFATQTKSGKSILALGASEVPAMSRKASRLRSPLERARASLTLSAVPKHMPCREREMEQVASFVQVRLFPPKFPCARNFRPRPNRKPSLEQTSDLPSFSSFLSLSLAELPRWKSHHGKLR